MPLDRGRPQGLMPSMLDRLIDPDAEGTMWRHGYGVAQMTDVVRRDLEELLNTRRTLVGIDPDYREMLTSIAVYGLPDLSMVDASAPGEREQIGKQIEEIIARYEPRLKDVKARLVHDEGTFNRTVRFQIEARLSVDPAPEVSFETVVELMSGRTLVKTGER